MGPAAPGGQKPDVERLLAQGDAGYRPVPAFEEWLNEPVDLASWDRAADELRRARDEASSEAVEASLRSVLRGAAVDTGAIEGLYTTDRGFTWSVAQGLALEQIEVEKGAEVRRLFESQLAGFELALDVATARTEVSEALIRRLHEVTCAGQESYRVLTPLGVQTQRLPLGEYKPTPNHVVLEDGAVHSYAPVDEVIREMHRLVTELRSERVSDAHPVVQAAYAHHALTWIHPFADGNGRVARVLASIYLLRAASVPFVVYADERDGYLATLLEADRGDTGAWIGWSTARSVALLRELAESLINVGALDTVRQRIEASGPRGLGLTHFEVNSAARVVLDRLVEILDGVLGSAGTSQVSSMAPYVDIASGTAAWASVEELPQITLGVHFDVVLQRARWVSGEIALHFTTGDDPVDAFRLVAANSSLDLVIARDEIYPRLTAALDRRLRRFASRVLASLIDAPA